MRERITATVHRLAARHMWASRSCWWRTAACWTCCTAPATGQDIQAPRTWQLGNAAINRLLWTPEGLSLVGWADTQHLDNAVRDETTPDPAGAAASIGQRVDRIDTPALVVDLDAMERNIARMADFARKHQVRWRPHAKMHKSAELALLLQQRRGRGRVRAKDRPRPRRWPRRRAATSPSPTRSSPPQAARVARLATRLQAQGGRLALAVDSAEGIERLAEAMAQAGSDAASTCWSRSTWARAAAACRRARPPWRWPRPWRATQLRFAGLQAYHGRAQHLRSAAERREAIAARRAGGAPHARPHRGRRAAGAAGHRLGHRHAGARGGQRRVWRAAGGLVPVHGRRLRPQRARPGAARVRARAVRQDAGHLGVRDTHAVCDAGHKSHAIDSGLPTVALLPADRALRYANGGDEHGMLYADGPRCPPARAGPDMLWLVPGHCDPTVNLHDFLIGVRGGLATAGVVERIIRVDARGALT
jgi:3-hydroxy-D-aspartate aldolase